MPKLLRKPFAVTAIAMMTAYTHGVLILSPGGQVAHDLVNSPNALVNGGVLALFAISSGVVGIIAKPLASCIAMTTGALASAGGMALLALAVAEQSLSVFLLATIVAGSGYSLLFLSALEVINGATPAPQHGEVLSAMYLLAYLSLGVVAPLLGRLATTHGLGFAVNIGARMIAFMSLVTFVLAQVMRGIASLSSRRS